MVLCSGQYDQTLVIPSHLTNIIVVGEKCEFLRSVKTRRIFVFLCQSTSELTIYWLDPHRE